MRDLHVWAYHTDFGTLCGNARLGGSGHFSYPAGNQQGQAGWDVAISFATIRELARKLGGAVGLPRQQCGNWIRDCDPIRPGEIVRLAILAHGDQGGRVAINGRSCRSVLEPATVAGLHPELHAIGLATRQTATILLMGCLAGQGQPGTDLLVGLSRVWRGRTVVGFSTVGYRHPGMMKRAGEACEMPGMRETDATAYIFANPRRFDGTWMDLNAMPWASETSPHAKAVRNAIVTKQPIGETIPAVPGAAGRR